MTSAPVTLDLLGEPVRLASPAALWLLGAVAALALAGALSIASRRRTLLRLAGPLAARIAPGAGAARPAARLGLEVLGLGLLALALSRPQCGTRTEISRPSGIDLALALDVSRSMLARDEKPDRLGRAKLEIGALLDRLAGDRVALVLFAADAFVECPLTSDHAAARLLLRGAGPGSIPRQGTSLAAALRAAGEVLSASDRTGRSRAVVILSDGEAHEPGSESAADALARDGVRVFAVGFGSPEGAPLPALDERGGPAGARRGPGGGPILTRLDEPSLRAIAERTGGRYLRASGAPGLPELAEELSRMERSEIEGRTEVTWEERYDLFALPGLLSLLAAGVLRQRPRRPAAEEARP